MRDYVGLRLDFILRLGGVGVALAMGVGGGHWSWCGGERNGVRMDRRGRGLKRVERYPRLFSVRAHWSGRPVFQKFSSKEMTFIDWEPPRFTEEKGRG